MKQRRWEDVALLGVALLGVGLALRGARHARRDLERLLVDGVNGSAWIAGMVGLAVERIRIVKRTLYAVTALFMIFGPQHQALRALRIAVVIAAVLDDWKSYIIARGRRSAEAVERKRKAQQSPPEPNGGTP